jgi:hypothetical protein
VLTATCQDNAVRELRGALAEPDVRAERLELGSQRSVIDLAPHELFRQRRPVIGRSGFGADQRDRALVAKGAQLLDGTQPGEAGACHHDPRRIARRHLVLQHSPCLPGPGRPTADYIRSIVSGRQGGLPLCWALTRGSPVGPD